MNRSSVSRLLVRTFVAFTILVVHTGCRRDPLQDQDQRVPTTTSAPKLGTVQQAIGTLTLGQACNNDEQCAPTEGGVGHCIDTVCCNTACGATANDPRGARDNLTCSNVYGVVPNLGDGLGEGYCTVLKDDEPCGKIESTNPNCTWRGTNLNGGDNCPNPNSGFTEGPCFPCVLNADCPPEEPVCDGEVCKSGCTGDFGSAQGLRPCPDADFPVCPALGENCVACRATATAVGPVNTTNCTLTAPDQCHTAGSCDAAGSCVAPPAKADGTGCDDANACTQTDTCQAGVCTGGNPVSCTALDQCHDAGTCDPGTGSCSNPNKADGETCSDGSMCTQTDTCIAGSCTGGNPVTCTALDQCHDVGACNPGTGVCSNPNLPDDTACTDGNDCTVGDKCTAGACVAGTTTTCTASDQCHGVGACLPDGSCTNPVLPNGTTCNDGDACSQTDTCQVGVCTGANPVTCTALDQCHGVGTCNPGSGTCSNPNLPDDTVCTDGNACTVGDKCTAGACVAGTGTTCTASDQCHIAGSCLPDGSCTNPEKPNGSGCNDDNACTQSDTCQSGTCTGASPVACPAASDQCHVVGTCNPSTGVCSDPAAPNGTPCNDGNACLQTDTCQAGACVGSNPVVCTQPINTCFAAGTCNPATGVCSDGPELPNGAPCDDGDFCSQRDQCNGAGKCIGSHHVECPPPSDSCHVSGTCNPANGICGAETAKPNGASCNDDNACTTGEACQSAICVGGTAVVCTASDQCHVAGTCSPQTGCSNPAAPNGTACNDNTVCTTDDTCQAGSCTGQAMVCDDGIACTTNSCDAVQGCVFTPTNCPVDAGADSGADGGGSDAGSDAGITVGCTFAQATWGVECQQNNTGCFRDQYFDAVFGANLVIGGTFTATFSNSAAIATFLPTTGTPPVPLTQSYVDPATTVPASVFAGEVLALRINVAMHDAAMLGGPLLGNLKVSAYTSSGPFGALTVRQLLTLAEDVLGGDVAALVPHNATITQLNDAITSVNTGGAAGCVLPPGGCTIDGECGGAASGLICEGGKCIPGCRPDGPVMECMPGQICQPVSGDIGLCVVDTDGGTDAGIDAGGLDGGTDGGGTDSGTDGGIGTDGGTDGGRFDGGGTDGGKEKDGSTEEDFSSIEGGGCACNTLGSSDGRPLGALAVSALTLAALLRRRRRHEAR